MGHLNSPSKGLSLDHMSLMLFPESCRVARAVVLFEGSLYFVCSTAFHLAL